MSLSWIHHLRSLFAPKTSAGIVIGRQHVGVAEVAQINGQRQVTQLAETALDMPLFHRPPTSGTVSLLAQALKKTATPLANRYIPIYVSIPDAAARIAIFELDQLPPTRAAQIELTRWRLARESSNEIAQRCDCQPLGEANGKPLLFSLALDERWHQCIEEALDQAGIVAWTLSANGCRQFNRFQMRFTGSSGALITVTPDTWSLWLWDNHGRPRYVQSRWTTPNDQESMTDIIADIERAIVAYVNSGPDRTIERLYVIANPEADTLIKELDTRLHQPSIRLPVAEGLTFDSTINTSAPWTMASLAAALES